MALDPVAQAGVGGHQEDPPGAENDDDDVCHGNFLPAEGRAPLCRAGWRKGSMAASGLAYKGWINAGLAA